MQHNGDSMESKNSWTSRLIGAKIHQFTCQESAYVGEGFTRFKDTHFFSVYIIFSFTGFLVNLQKCL